MVLKGVRANNRSAFLLHYSAQLVGLLYATVLVAEPRRALFRGKYFSLVINC